MLGELIYILNGEKSNRNKCKNVLGKNERIGLRKKVTETRAYSIDNAVRRIWESPLKTVWSHSKEAYL